MNLEKKYNHFINNVSGNCSFMPFNNQTYNIYSMEDKNKLIKQFGNKLYMLGLSNTFNKTAIRKAKNLGVLMFGKWNKCIDISVLINNKSKSDVLKLAKQFKQKTIIEITNNKADEIKVI